MVDTVHLKSPVIEHDKSSRLPRAVERLESRAWHAYQRDATVEPCVKSASAKLFLDLHTVLAPSGEERTLDASAQVERAGRCCRRFDSGTQAKPRFLEMAT